MTGTRHGVLLAVALAVASAGGVVAAQQLPYRASDQQLKDLVTRIDTHREAFHASLERAIDRSPINGSSGESQIDNSVEDFEKAADLLRDRVRDRQSGTTDAANVLRRASFIDELMMRNQFDASAQGDWRVLRLDMNDLARAYGIPWSWSSATQNLQYRLDDKQVEQLLKQIGERAGRFDKSLERAFDRGGIDDRPGKDEIRQSVKDFRQTADRLRDRVKSRESNALDVEEVLRRGASIDGFMQRYQLNAQAEQNWLTLRGDLDELARAYSVAWNWSDADYTPAESRAGFHHRLTGTYQLENDGGADVRQAAERAASSARSDARQRTFQSLLTRLEAPSLIAIERNDNSVTMASTRGRRVTVEADGRDHVEQWSAGRTMNTRATFQGERLMVAATGNRGDDFEVTFDPAEDGRSLQMTRTVDDEGLRQPVTVRSSYRRLSDDARWNMVVSVPRAANDDTRYRAADLAVPYGTRMVALLDTPLSTTNAREGDLYTMTTRSPSEYEGAVIQGFVSTVNESGRLTGHAGMTLNLRSIRLRNGGSYPFDGVIEDVRTPDGETVTVGHEGAADAGTSQTRKAVERGAIGAALGAVIGAVVGGGKGAAIGAVIGAGGGAGTVIVQGRQQMNLQRGTEVTITSGDTDDRRTAPGGQR